MLQFIDLEKNIDVDQYLQLVSNKIISMGYKATPNNLIQMLRLHQREAIRNNEGVFLSNPELEILMIKELLEVLKKNVIRESVESEPANELSDTIHTAFINQKIAENQCKNIKEVLQKYQ